jgi:AcrR family transcriptional regulator
MNRWGLRDSSFVPCDEAEELMAVFAAVVYERGYAATRLTDVAQRAGVPVDVLTAHLSTEVDWLLETAAASTRRLFARVADAFMDIPDDAPRALHHGLAVMLRDMAAAPEMVHLSTVELPALGPLVRHRRIRALDLFRAFLDPALAALDEPLPGGDDAITLCITGGIWELIRRHALERRLHELPDALPSVSHVLLSTLFGVDEAMRVGTLEAAGACLDRGPVGVAPQPQAERDLQ